MTNVRIPQPTSIVTAIRLYYEKIELNNKDIATLFGDISSATISRLKKRAREQMVEDGVQSWNAMNVNVKSAFKAWGLDIDDLEKRYDKLKKLGIA